jgi:hypothetical protein
LPPPSASFFCKLSWCCRLLLLASCKLSWFWRLLLLFFFKWSWPCHLLMLVLFCSPFSHEDGGDLFLRNDVTTHDMVLFIVTAMRTPNPTTISLFLQQINYPSF